MNYNAMVRISYVVLSGFALPIMKLVSLYFPMLNNNTVRFLSGGIFFTIMSLVIRRQQFFQMFTNKLIYKPLIIASILNTLNMILFLTAIEMTSAVTGSIFLTIGMPINTMLAAIIFVEERNRIKNPLFITGAIIALIGSIIFILGRGLTTSNTLGALLFSTAILVQGTQNIFFKKTSKHASMTVLTAGSALITGTLFLIMSSLTNTIYQLKEVPISLVALLGLAGIYGMWVGLLIGVFVMKTQGIMIFNILQLIAPISTAVVSYLILGEVMNPTQILGGIIVGIGCTLVFKTNAERACQQN